MAVIPLSSSSAAAAANNNFTNIENERDDALIKKRICVVAFVAIPILASALIFSGALALPHASFLLSTGVPSALLLIVKLYVKFLGSVEEYEGKLSFERRVLQWNENRSLAYVDRALSVYIPIKKEIERLNQSLPLACGLSKQLSESHGETLRGYWDTIEHHAFPDLFDAVCSFRGISKIEDLGILVPLARTVRLELDLSQPSPYFIHRNTSSVSFQDIEKLLHGYREPSSQKSSDQERMQKLLSELNRLVPSSNA